MSTIRMVTIAAILAAAGCGSRAADVGSPSAQPVALTRDAACDLDGMILMDYVGPKAQVLRKDGTRAFFCSADEIFGELIDPVRRNRIDGAWVQTADDGNWKATAGAWAPAASCVYVIGSSKMGAMGPTFAPFSSRDAADAFAAKFGGEVRAFSAIDAACLKAHREAVTAALENGTAGGGSE